MQKLFRHALSIAFPGLKEIDLSVANKPAVTVAQKVQVITQPKTKSKPTALQTTNTDDKIKPFSLIQTIQQKIRIKQNAPVLIGIISLLLAAVVALTMLNKKQNTDGETTNSLTQNRNN